MPDFIVSPLLYWFGFNVETKIGKNFSGMILPIELAESKSPTISPLFTIPEILNDTLPIPPLFSVTDLMTNKSYP